jgi:anthranilate synthase component 2
MLILIDNYDSFTHNIAQYCGGLGAPPVIIRNDAETAQSIIDRKPKAIILSPGPCSPTEAGICLGLIELNKKAKIPMLGICLGHQAMGQAFGGKIVRTKPVHGKTSTITHNKKRLFTSLPSPMTVTRYHSLIIDKTSCPPELKVTAQTEDGIIMAVQHKSLPFYGVQFHPESIATDHGYKLIENFLSLTS